MSETKPAHVAACALALSAFSLAVVGVWALAGASIPSPEALPAVASPLSAMLLLLTREGFPAVAAAIAWILAFDVALAVVVVALLVARARRSPQASRLALAIALLAAGFTILFLLQSLSPFDAWAAVLNERASRAIAIGGRVLGVAMLSSVGVFLVSLGLWVLFRFWMAYPVAVDAEAVGAFAAARAASVFLRTNPVSRLFGKPSQFAVDQWSRGRAPWFGPDSSRGPWRGSLGQWFRKWTIASVVVWTAASLALTVIAGSTSRGMHRLLPIVAILGGMPLVFLIPTSMARIADVVAYQFESAGEHDRRRIEWLHAAGAVARFAADGVWLIVFMSALAWLTVETFVLERAQPSFENAPYVIVFVFPFTVLPAVFILGLGASMLARGLIDPRLALRKITLWTVLGLLLTFVFVAIERLVALQLVRWFALPPDSGAIVAGAAVAMTFVPLRRAVQGWVSRYVEHRMPVHVLADGERHTGAVAVVDISGFTALTAQDESAALLATTLLQREAKRLADAHEGRVVKSTGDGVMLAFARALDAIAAVRELYKDFARMRESLSLPPIALHAGVHWGEYVDVRGTDIYGHTVNLASRLADAAGPDEILASEAFSTALGRVEPAPVRLGMRRFKNVAEPVACVRM